ncbi:glycohydrolase toxin TNT-related protein [Fictibacillus sp. KU28468]|uniref:glycohydrolase toxin TNT-related protein n=1 Tax=Fictibacillus sp. KU28468 TaxID=2991053 RepID=UPI00223C8F75|nr:glycohydrolase toxin TNT-related protein [Fictibacillus sp. KU28468]UZJ79700.1 glycohydrolase toxin TNT-related protein [Fictibacillus sp. KU28468]
MSQISVKPDELEALASDIGKLESQCSEIKGALKWDYLALHAAVWDIDHTSAGSLYHSLIQKLEHYEKLLDSAQEVVKRTEAKFREADQGWFGKAKEFGMEVVGVNDVIRIFAEYDPVTGEKLDGWDRLKAVGWTALTIFPPAKVLGMGGKAVIKGAKVLHMGDKAAEVFRGMMKVLHPNVIRNAFKSALAGIKEFPLFPRFSRAVVSSVGIQRVAEEPFRVKDFGTQFSKLAGTVDRKISETDRLKLKNWKYPPSEEKYFKHKDVYDNPKYYNQETGEINWPGTKGDPNIDGFVDGKFEVNLLESGKEIDRYGSNLNGQFFSPKGASYESRALPPHMIEQPYSKYIIKRDFHVRSGEIAPWFDEVGGGVQYHTKINIIDDYGNSVEATVENLIKYGYIEIIK